MKNDALREKMKEVLIALKNGQYRETSNFLTFTLNDSDQEDKDFCAIANKLLHCDQPKTLPAVVRELIILLFQMAFESGNADAMNDLGAQYYDGNRGFEQDYGKAVHYYEIAAKNGSRQAQENLGYCYYYGRNMPVDYEKAFHYFALGAFDGHPISLYKIADMYANGYYVEKNEKEAFHIYEYCMEHMAEETAKFVAGPVYLRLGNCFLYGTGTEPNPETALICYQKAELFLFGMVKGGNVMYKKSLQDAIDGQTKARAIMAKELPG